MIKTYITGISQHTRTELLQLWYQPDGFELEHNRKTSFPIIPVIAEQEYFTYGRFHFWQYFFYHDLG